MRHSLRLSLALLLAVTAAGVGLGRSEARAALLAYPEVPQIVHWRQVTWRWERVMSVPLSRVHENKTDPSAAYRRWVVALWKHKAVRTRSTAVRPQHLAAWTCIHRYEAAWDDPNPPYYGGLQMDMRFQLTYARALYARKGTADHWTPLEQMWVAEKALRSVGFSAWPNTARMCGLF